MHDSTFIDFTAQRKLFLKRIVIASVTTIFIGFLIVTRYYNLQVTNHQDFVTQADNNRVHVRPASPPRGLIYDRNGSLLADNISAYNLTIVRDRADDLQQLLENLKELIVIADSDIAQFEKSFKRRKPYENTALKFNLSEQERSILAVNSYRLDGAEVSARLSRYYPDKELFAHVVGYVGRINEEESQTIDLVKYSGSDSIGKIGIEKEYENILLGEVGSEHVETNARGRVMRLLNKVDPIPGQNLTLHIDGALQATAHRALAGTRGALVAIEIESGGILAMVSTPSYDPNPFVIGIGSEKYSSLLESPDRPLFNRAIRGQYPPGSTLKPMFGLIGLQEQIVDFEHTIHDSGYFHLPGVIRPWRDHNAKKGGHGADVDLARAIIESCDVYFYSMAIDTDIDILSSRSRSFGMGQLTNLDIPGEQPGIMPTREWKEKSLNEDWFDGDTVNASIGQGFVLTTPLQLAVMTARIASRGKIVEPRLVKAIGDIEKSSNLVAENININSEHWDFVHQAMNDVVHSPKGTAYKISEGLTYQMAGKTGTAQVISIQADDEYDKEKISERQWDHALFIAFAPLENPKIAVALIIENGGHGSMTAAPLARLVIDEYMKTHASQDLAQW